jgi:hypothetical protein
MSGLELVSSLGGSGDSVPIVIITAHDDARVRDDPAGRSWRLTDALSESVYEHDGDEVHAVGLPVDLEG